LLVLSGFFLSWYVPAHLLPSDDAGVGRVVSGGHVDAAVPRPWRAGHADVVSALQHHMVRQEERQQFIPYNDHTIVSFQAQGFAACKMRTTASQAV
jgi:hypothetical protein